MKTKKTIRKLKSPLAKNLAKLSRNLHSMRKVTDKLTDQVEDQAFELRAAHKKLNAIKTKQMSQQTALDSAIEVAELFPEDKS